MPQNEPEQIDASRLIADIVEVLTHADRDDLLKAARQILAKPVRFVETVVGEDMFEYLPDVEGEVTAEAWDDNRAFTVSFNAARWFAQATPEEIEHLAHFDWGIHQAADEVALYMEDFDRDLANMFEFKAEDAGYECQVDEASALAWLAQYRPDVHAYLQEQKG